nr:hypothetical transcript [Hymenolepis microstoma]
MMCCACGSAAFGHSTGKPNNAVNQPPYPDLIAIAPLTPSPPPPPPPPPIPNISPHMPPHPAPPPPYDQCVNQSAPVNSEKL